MSKSPQISLIKKMREVIRAGRQSLTNSHLTGVELLRAGEYEKAAVCLREDLAANPNFYSSYHYLGEALYKLKDFSEAEKSFSKSAALNPYFAPTQAFLGDTALENGEFVKAEAFYRRAIEFQPTLFQAHRGLLKVFYKLNNGADESKWSEADKIFSDICQYALVNRQLLVEVIDLGLPDARLYKTFGDFLKRDNQIESAVVCYQLALSFEPENAEIWLKLAQIFFDAGENEYAADCQSRAANLARNSVEVHSLLGEICNKQNKYAEAIAAYRQALELEPKNAEFHKIIGDLQTKQGLINDARSSYNSAIELGYQIY